MGGADSVAEFEWKGEESGERLLWMVVSLLIQATVLGRKCLAMLCIVQSSAAMESVCFISSQVKTRLLQVRDRCFR